MSEQRIDILPIGTRARLKCPGSTEECGAIAQVILCPDGLLYRVRVDGEPEVWYARPSCIVEVLSRPARKVTLVIEEEGLASKEYYDRLDASCAAQLAFEEQERQSERDKRLIEADRLVRASLDRKSTVAPF